MSITSSPPPDASGTARGLVSLLAQTFAGVKTFAATIIASAGIQLSSLWNTNGTGASDVGVKVGVSTADASVNAAAKLLSVRTGLNGGTEVEKWYVAKDGSPGPVSDGVRTRIGTGNAFFYSSAAGTVVYCATYFEVLPGLNIQNDSMLSHTGQTLGLHSRQNDGASAIAIKLNAINAFSTAGAKLVSVQNNSVEKAFFAHNGELEETVAGAGLVLKSPDGTRWRITVTNAGALNVAAA